MCSVDLEAGEDYSFVFTCYLSSSSMNSLKPPGRVFKLLLRITPKSSADQKKCSEGHLPKWSKFCKDLFIVNISMHSFLKCVKLYLFLPSFLPSFFLSLSLSFSFFLPFSLSFFRSFFLKIRSQQTMGNAFL
ncbi:hypothetical protein llap_13414 [Limosa lapponica baueri]|uniref:Uncharacterized protein n=1 Tax=Limosa lapponica baueri TaxID=1758121 RepID=A0A2I0TR55_LIMLA|nr:hypothetical protein llap_13414 [Limosa lapponica baueri]